MLHTVIETEWVPLKGGTKLAARIWLPKSASATPAPAVLEFLPYRRRDGTAARDEATYPAFADAGIAGVRVDLRGTGDSEGLFDDEYSETELADAEDVIAWIAAQPWCNGNVGMMGISWGGFNAFQVAARRPPALKAVISIASTVDRFADDIHFKAGAMLSANLYWATQMLGRAARAPDADVVGETWRDTWMNRLENLPALIEPWMAHQRRDDYWKHGSICEDFETYDTPSLVIAGWADGYRNTPWKARDGLGDNVRSITGPWVHLYPHFATPAPRADFLGEAIRWWRRWLMDDGQDVPDAPAHRLWVSEAVEPDGTRKVEPGRWVAIQQDDSTTRTLHLAPASLTEDMPTEDAEQIIKTPLDCGVDAGEFFTQGGRADLPGDQRRDDGLSVIFETVALAEPLEIIGCPELSVELASDTPQATLIGRLVDVHPDGTSHRITLGVLNLSHRDSSATPTPMTPGHKTPIRLSFDATAYRLRAGHKLRLALSTHYFPMILPPPVDPTLTLSIGTTAKLKLPCPATTPVEIAEGTDTRPVYPSASPGSEDRRMRHDRTSGRTTVTVLSDTGTLSHPGNGIEWQETEQADWSVVAGELLSLTGVLKYMGRRVRNGHETKETATTQLKVTATDWLVETALVATENGQTVFERSWSFVIPRDHM